MTTFGAILFAFLLGAITNLLTLIAAHQHRTALETKRRFALEAPPFCDTLIGAIAAARIVAKKCGYAIAHHGSLARDIDLIAVPWTDDAASADFLVDSIVEAVQGWINPAHPNRTEKPHGRLAWSIHLLGYGTYIDLSVMPRCEVKP